ncbi:MAG: hypothetical protein R2733_24340 [Acidimicrobiales bacterium]
MRLGTDTAGLAGRVAAAFAAVTATLTLVAAPVAAQPTPPDPGPPAPINPLPITPACPDTGGGGAAIDQNGGAVLGTCWGNTPGSGPDITVSSALVWNWYGCDQWRPYSPGSTVSAVSPQGELLLEDIIARGLDPTVTYVWHTVECTHVQRGAGADGADLVEIWGWGLLVIGTTAPVDPLTLRDIAAARIDPEPPTPATSPMWGEVASVVNMSTWLWVTDDWEPVEEEESQGFVTVVVQARPVETSWDTGDGTTVVCANGPGVPWAPGMASDDTYCSHTFTAAGTGLAGSATTTWTFRWWLNGNDMGDFGDFTRTTPISFDVTEIQAIETGR